MAWIQTRSGPFDFDQCGPMDFDTQTIAHALGNLCRWNGHTSRFYSVAEHSVLMARQLLANYEGDQPRHHVAFLALLHDAPEAYLGDVTRPLKKAIGDVYSLMESRIMAKICAKYCVSVDDPGWGIVKAVDDQICIDERRALLPPIEKEEAWAVQGPGLGVDIYCWEPHIATAKFNELWHEIGRMS